MNFYKFDIDKESDIGKLEFLKPGAVVSFKCLDTLKEKLNYTLSKEIDLTASKIIYYSKEVDNKGNTISELQSVDHLKKFKQFVIDNLGNTKIVSEELGEVCK